MHIAKRSVLTVLALLTAIFVAVGSALSMAVALAATALIVPGTGTPKAGDVEDYMANALNYYISPFNGSCTEDNDCDLKPIDYPAQFWPIPLPGWGGLKGDKWDVSTGQGLSNLNSTLVDTLAQDPPNTPIVIFGYSQGGNIVSREKRSLSYLPKDQHYLSFVMIGNTNRPNGGLFERLAFLGHVPILDATFGMPAPTTTCDHECATDIAFEYDGVADFPLYPLNALATLNAIAGFWYIHGTYLAPDGRTGPDELPDGYTPEELAEELQKPENQTVYGDTRYITLPTKQLPLVRPFLEFGGFTHTTFIVKPIVDLLEPVLRVLIDTGYDRSLSPGVPAPFRLIPTNINPIKLAGDIVTALGEGVKAALADIGVKTAKKPAPITTTTTNLAAAKADVPQPVSDKKSTVVTSKVADEATDETAADPKVTDQKVTDDKKTGEPATSPAPQRPKVRGPIGSGPLAQLVRQFGDALKGKHGIKAGTSAPETAAPEPEPKPDTKADTKADTETTKPATDPEPAAQQHTATEGAAA